MVAYSGVLHNVLEVHYRTIVTLVLEENNLKISEWLGGISVTRVLETTLADHKWTDGGVKSDVLTPNQGSSSVMTEENNCGGVVFHKHLLITVSLVQQ